MSPTRARACVCVCVYIRQNSLSEKEEFKLKKKKTARTRKDPLGSPDAAIDDVMIAVIFLLLVWACLLLIDDTHVFMFYV